MSRDYGRPLEFGLSIVPTAADLETSRGPSENTELQLECFTSEVVPGVRETVERKRSRRGRSMTSDHAASDPAPPS